ncbi:hypothetical protein MLD52_12355 [Puniceicoccaceae bacterium K14]|nr:hypothetical protein [Puniceicoccaceae bacterium K14]
MPSLQELLIENQPTTSGIHEAMAQHAEQVFEELHGVLPIFLGKRKTSGFINLSIPTKALQNRDILLATLSNLIKTYNLSVASFVSTIRAQFPGSEEPQLAAILITADSSNAVFQLPWELQFDATSNLSAFKRTHAEGFTIDEATWKEMFQETKNLADKAEAYGNLVEVFGGEDQLPRP